MKRETTYRKTEVVENSYGMLKPFNALEPSFRVEQLLSTEPEAMGEGLAKVKEDTSYIYAGYELIITGVYMTYKDGKGFDIFPDGSRMLILSLKDTEWEGRHTGDYTIIHEKDLEIIKDIEPHPKPVEPKQPDNTTVGIERKFIKDFIEAWEDGQGGDSQLYREAKNILESLTSTNQQTEE